MLQGRINKFTLGFVRISYTNSIECQNALAKFQFWSLERICLVVGGPYSLQFGSFESSKNSHASANH